MSLEKKRKKDSTHGISSAKRNLIPCLIEHIKHITVTSTHIICHVMLVYLTSLSDIYSQLTYVLDLLLLTCVAVVSFAAAQAGLVINTANNSVQGQLGQTGAR